VPLEKTAPTLAIRFEGGLHDLVDSHSVSRQGCRKTEVVNMDQEEHFEIYDGIVVPASALRQEQHMKKYGTISDLPQEELAEPDELERVAYKEMWWPILRLPQQRWECSIRPNMDEDGRVDWGAFGSVDFDSYRPQFDKLRYKTEKLREKLKDLVVMLKIVSARIPGRAKMKILRLVGAGVLDIGDISDNQMYFFAEMYLRALRMRVQIVRLREKRKQRKEEELEVWLAE
jgi:hypothetical protein